MGRFLGFGELKELVCCYILLRRLNYMEIGPSYLQDYLYLQRNH